MTPFLPLLVLAAVPVDSAAGDPPLDLAADGVGGIDDLLATSDDLAEPPAAAADGGEPKVIFLWYADGTKPPTESSPCAGTIPPKLDCSSFGKNLEDCQRQLQSYLDKWYMDFNVIFTLTMPTSGTFYSEV